MWESETTRTLGIAIVVGLVVVALLVPLLRSLIKRDVEILRLNAGRADGIPFSAMFILIILGGTVLLGLLFWIFQPAQDHSSSGFGTLAGLILLGMVVFIGIMNILTLSASRIGMLDGRQPFGLPEGSVRAILTIAFIVLVGVLSSFLLTGSNNRTGYSARSILLQTVQDEKTAQDLARDIRATQGGNALVAIERVGPLGDAGAVPPVEAAGTQGDTAPTASPGPEFRIVVYPKVDNSVADDISKQTLTMVSTILAAMIGFYFATRSDAGAADPANVVRTDALKRLRELAESSKPEAALSTARSRLEEYKKRLAQASKGDAKAVAADDGSIQKWTDELAGLDATLKSAKAVGDDDNASYTASMEAARNIERVNAALPVLQKAIADKLDALPA
ncbi:hypothetical protein DFR52_106201 [Hoeflea marina]|uniref:Uncharacterized protein n=1 Tax=Hoeflea marina TaxID=274592 RepID=A0A317PJA6_9HYPH|nr:hypothetical protein [Hoeflea marina]PWV97677.1 hypothetical protein DFR52_106201 [Hoeflea marina]